MTTVVQRTFASGELSPELRAKSDVTAYSAGLKLASNVLIGKTGGLFNRLGTQELFTGSRGAVKLLGKLTHEGECYMVGIEEFGANATRWFGYRIGDPRYITPATRSLYRPEDVKDIRAIQVPDGILLTHRVFPPTLLTINTEEATERIQHEFYRPGRSEAEPPDADDFTLNRVGQNGSTTYRYALTAVDSFGQETSPVRAEITDGLNTALSTENRVDVTYSGPSGEYNVYKEQGGIYSLLSVASIPFGQSSFTVRDIGQTLSSDVSIPSLRPEIAPLVYTPTSVNTTTGQITMTRVEFPQEGEDRSGLAVGDQVAISGTYDTAAVATGDAVQTTVIRTISSISGFIDGSIGIELEGGIGGIFDRGIEETKAITSGAVIRQGHNPALVASYQNRLIYASTDDNPETVWLSRIGSFADFSRPFNLNDVSPFSFKLNSVEGGPVRGLVDVDGLKIFLEETEWNVLGNDAGIITPTQINAREISNHGSSGLQPLKTGDIALYEQKNGGAIRSIGRTPEASTDVSIFSSHLFRENNIVSWAYVKRPVPTVWAVRDDGLLLSLTLVIDQGVLAWTRHELASAGGVDVLARSVISIDDILYIATDAKLGTSAPRLTYLSMGGRFTPDRDPIFTDVSTVRTAAEFELSMIPDYKTATSPDRTDGLVAIDISNASSIFNATNDVDNYIFYQKEPNVYVADRIAHIDDSTDIMLVEREVATTYEVANDVLIRGVNFLDITLNRGESYKLSIVGDGDLVQSLEEYSYEGIAGTHTVRTSLPRGYRVVYYGIPFNSDGQTLDVDLTGPTIQANFKKISEVNMYVDSTQGLYVGNSKPSGDDGSVNGLALIRPDRRWEADGALMSSEGIVSVVIDPTWNSSGSIFVRQVDPLPFAIYSIVPSGSIPSPTSGGSGG